MNKNLFEAVDKAFDKMLKENISDLEDYKVETDAGELGDEGSFAICIGDELKQIESSDSWADIVTKWNNLCDLGSQELLKKYKTDYIALMTTDTEEGMVGDMDEITAIFLDEE